MLNNGYFGPLRTTTNTSAVGIFSLDSQEQKKRISLWPSTIAPADYEPLTFVASGNLTVTNNGTTSVDIFKTSGSNSWDNHAYVNTPYTAPCTIEFFKNAGSGDNGASYAMMAWNADPTANASYDSLDFACYPYATSNYQVYDNGTLVVNGGTWSTSTRWYLTYATDGYFYHYNGSSLLASKNYGTGQTVYIDSSFYSVSATFSGFTQIRVIRKAWNGTSYV